MKFRTEIPLNKVKEGLIDYDSRLFLIGSCFVENIGSKLNYFKFQSVHNPIGIFFHPLAIERFVQRIVDDIPYKSEDVFEMDGVWKSFEAHSQMNALNREDLLQNLNQSQQNTRKILKEATHAVITLGTAWVYEHQVSEKVVANCHKVPQKEFKKNLLSIEGIVSSLLKITSLLRQLNPTVKIIFTVSPIRHIKDGFVENTRSKAHLLAAIHQIIDDLDFFYFPAYEIMMDDLRDYRYYADDLVHPNNMAIDYIWNLFQKVWFSESTEPIMKRVDKIQKGLQHKPFNPESESYKAFLSQLEREKSELQKEIPSIHF